VAGEGTSEACSASLSTYQAGGICNDVVVNCPAVPEGIVCHEVTASAGGQTCVATSLTASTCPGSLLPGTCSSEGLVGCCITGLASTSGTNLDVATCIYDASELSAFQNACNGRWSTTAP
jgi:hypothetical protein